MLKNWKRQAEEFAKQKQGQKLTDKDDIINTLTCAFGGYSKTFTPTAIFNVHTASEKTLEALDSRFNVESSYINKTTHFKIYAKETVPFLLDVKSTYKKECFEKFQRLFEHGEDIEIDIEALSFKGSALLEEIPNIIHEGKIHIIPEKKKCVQKLLFINKLTLKEEYFDSIHGVVTYGQKSLSFIGSAYNGVFEIKCTKSWEKAKNLLNIKLKLEKWENQDIRYLPYFEKIYLFFKQLVEDWELQVIFEINGEELHKIEKISGENIESAKLIFQYLQYIKYAKVLFNYLNSSVKYIYEHSYTEKDYYELVEVIDILEGSYFLDKTIISSISTVIMIDDTLECTQLLRDGNNPIALMFIPNTQDEITIFNQVIRLPKKKFILTSVLPKIDKSMSEIKVGDLINVEFHPCNNFELKIEFIPNEKNP